MIKQIWGEVFLYARWSRELRFWLEEPSHQPGYFLWTPYCSLPPTLGEQHPYGEILWFVCRRLARAFCLVVTVVDIVDVVCYFVPKKKNYCSNLQVQLKTYYFCYFTYKTLEIYFYIKHTLFFRFSADFSLVL